MLLDNTPIQSSNHIFGFISSVNTDIFTIPFRLIDRYGKINISYPAFTFYDGYFKIHHRFNPSNRISFSYFDGADVFKVVDKSRTSNHPWESIYKYRQGTRFVSTTSQSKITCKLYHEGTLNYSWYDNKTLYHDVHTESAEKVINDFSYKNKLGTLSGKSLFKYYLNNSMIITSGFEVSALSGNPMEINIREAILPEFDTLIAESKGRTNAMAYHLFVENDFNFGNLKINEDVRYSIF